MKARVCLVTTGQPSTNPRLVKEADALTAAGYDVQVLGVRRAAWADASDATLLAARRWRARVLDPDRSLFGISRVASAVRHRIARRAGARWSDGWLASALTPVASQLLAAAREHAADLYIAHNLGALPAAAAAAAEANARLVFDAEDFHSGQLATLSDEREATELAEARFVPLCDAVTAASPGIAERYAPLCVEPPTVILNVFPLAERPTAHVAAAGEPFKLYWFSQTIGADRGLEDAVRAAGQLWDLNIELHLRGEWQAGYEERLRGLAAECGLPVDRLVALDPAPASEMVRLAAPYHAGLALEDGKTINREIALTNKLFTYLLAGVPVLASSTAAQRRFGQEVGVAAQLYEPGDVAGLAAVMRRWLDHPGALDAARRHAWALAEQKFNWDVEQRTFLDLVERVLSQAPRGRRAELAS